MSNLSQEQNTASGIVMDFLTALATTPPCPHPEEFVQSGIYARGVYCNAVCMRCGAELISTAEIIVTEELDVTP